MMVCRRSWLNYASLFAFLATASVCWGRIPGSVGGTKWATAQEEAQDEAMDPQLFQAVVDSIREYEAKHKHKLKHYNSTGRFRRGASGGEEDGVGGAGGGGTATAGGGKVCYQDVGCFVDDPGGYLVDMLPSSPEEVDTRFLVYSSRHSRRSDTPMLDVGFSNVSQVYHWAAQAFNVSAPTKVIVHGFGSSCSHVWVYEMRSALMSVENCNVMCVDWEKGATFPNYVRAAANTRLVGRQISMLLSSLNKRLGLDLDKVHVIGFSLGAHAAAFAGAELPSQYRINRITGLDPAGPLFESQEPAGRLDPSDAKFVDVIHSNGEALILGGLGSWEPMGHVDFYPNGGRMQKGCSNLFVGAFRDILSPGAQENEGRSLCNHRRAYKFFTDSVSPRCPFPALPCSSYETYLNGECFPCPSPNSCPSMGYYSDATRARGSLYLVTREEEPFCANQYLVRLDSSGGVLPVVSYGKIQMTLLGEDPHINETFTLTQKEDEELLVGGSLSRIIVPHPALNNKFTGVVLVYTAYSGWLSSGLAKWSIDSISLTDSYGHAISACKKEQILESGSPVFLMLSDGDCSPKSAGGTQHHSNSRHNFTSFNNDNNKTKGYYPATQVVYVDEFGEEVQVHSGAGGPGSGGIDGENVVLGASETNSNFLSDDSESSASSSVSATSGFRRAKLSLQPSSNGSSPSAAAADKKKLVIKSEPYEYEKVTASEEDGKVIREPILDATTKRNDQGEVSADLRAPPPGATESWLHWTSDRKRTLDPLDHPQEDGSEGVKKRGAETDSSGGGGWRLRNLTVQLLPERLIAFIQQAEKYARLAFSPFIGRSEDPEDQAAATTTAAPTTQQRWNASKKRSPQQGRDARHRKDSVVAVRHLEKKDTKYIPLARNESSPPADHSTPSEPKEDFNIPPVVAEHMELPVPPQHTEYHSGEPVPTSASTTTTSTTTIKTTTTTSNTTKDTGVTNTTIKFEIMPR